MIDRISRMEHCFDEVTRMLAELDGTIGKWEDAKDQLEVLKDYMASGDWRKDYEADEAGKLPAGLKRGVLSQDGLYDLLQDADKILRHALEVLGK
ncbi:MAG: DUF4298 domain-containing protein [Bacteroidales bacterium]|nr:DUF4298 domain-containing protein [Bacteroidales bacterium]